MNKTKVLEAFLQKPQKYRIEVKDKSTLPPELKDRKEIYFPVKSPSLHILSECGLVLERIPKELRDKIAKGESPPESLNYIKNITEIFCLMSWGKAKKLPKWYVPFVLANVTPEEMYKLYYEMSLKMQPGFFLSCIQVAEMINPTTTRTTIETKSSTLTN